MVIAYIRISTEKQDLEIQKGEITRYTSNKNIIIDQWVEEVISGSVSKKDRKLEKVIKRLKKDDTLIITEISRLSRTLLEILTIMEDCIKRGINVYSVKDGYTFDNSINSTLLIFVFGLISEVERKLISIRTKEALIGLKQKGVILGRPIGSRPARTKLVLEKEEIKQMLKSGIKIIDICREYGVSRNTFDRFRKDNNL